MIYAGYRTQRLAQDVMTQGLPKYTLSSIIRALPPAATMINLTGGMFKISFLPPLDGRGSPDWDDIIARLSICGVHFEIISRARNDVYGCFAIVNAEVCCK